MNFLEAERTYRKLMQQRQAGQITEVDFVAAIQTLRVHTSDGIWWQMRASDGAWLRWDGTSWTEARPGGVSASTPKKKRNPVISCLMILGIFVCASICLLVVVGAGGYYLVSTGQWSQREILNAVGLGTGEITIINIADDSLDTKLIQMDTESGSPETVNSEIISTFEISGYGGIQPGLYELHISSQSGIPAGGICRLSIVSGDSFQFVAVPSGIAVTQKGADVQNADDVDMLTSGLCR
jgi:hypothetical protein